MSDSTPLQEYVRHMATKPEQLQALQLAAKLTAHKSTAVINHALAAVLLENLCLTLEVNEHRAARGFRPLPVIHNS